MYLVRYRAPFFSLNLSSDIPPRIRTFTVMRLFDFSAWTLEPPLQKCNSYAWQRDFSASFGRRPYFRTPWKIGILASSRMVFSVGVEWDSDRD